MIITGNEESLTVGLSQGINCTWGGEGNVSKMEWFVVGLEAVPVETAIGTEMNCTLTQSRHGRTRRSYVYLQSNSLRWSGDGGNNHSQS